MISSALDFDLRSSIRTIPDYPKPGIMFRDITTLLGNARAFRRAVDELVQPWAGSPAISRVSTSHAPSAPTARSTRRSSRRRKHAIRSCLRSSMRSRAEC